jgi:hypothetical protein
LEALGHKVQQLGLHISHLLSLQPFLEGLLPNLGLQRRKSSLPVPAAGAGDAARAGMHTVMVWTEP